MRGKGLAKPKLSVIIPLRNTKAYHREPDRLETVLDSLAAQTALHDIEVIVSDFGSGPSYKKQHAAIIKKSGLGKRCRHVYISTSEPWNISRARNVGARDARGIYIVTLDVDCLLAPSFCEALLETISEGRIVHCQVWELPEGYRGSLTDFEAMKAQATLRPKHGLGSCQAVSRKWAESVHGWDERFVTWGAEDTDFCERAVLAGKENVWLDALYFHQYHSQGNRKENAALLAKNRRRLELTKAKQLPLLRNSLAWGGKPVDPMPDTAILITTFMRDELLFRCVKTCKKYYPELPIFVADCGKLTPDKSQFIDDYELTHIQAPFDAGVSAMRNLGMAAIPAQYKYVVIIEDDIILREESDLGKWRRILDAEPKIGVVGGLLKQTCMSSHEQDQHYEGTLEIQDRTLYIRALEKPSWKTVDGVKYCLADIILNVFMMRREVWDSVKWDDRIKAAPEHCHWFLALKQRTQYHVAYAPEVVLEHAKVPIAAISPGYETFRRRNEGFQFLAETWDIDFIWSSWHVRHGFPNPLNIRERAEDKSATMLRNLKSIVEILNNQGCKWWLEAGTCLGAIRERGFIKHDQDIDIGVPARYIDKWDAVIKDCEDAGFELYKEWEHDGRRIELSLARAGIKVDIFWFYESGDNLWHGAFGFDRVTPGRHGEFLPHVFPAALFSNLQKITFLGLECYVPNPPEAYLEARYGPDWKTPRRDYCYWNDCRAIDRAFLKDKPEVFIGGVWDLFHVGHARILERCKRLARNGRLTVGVLTDEAASRYKPRPIIPQSERMEIVTGFNAVDEAMLQSDRDPAADFERMGYKPDYIVHGSDWSYVPGAEYVGQYGGCVKLLPYTNSISSTDIKKRIIDRGIEEPPKVAITEDFKIAIGIKTFMREAVLWKNLDAIKKYCPFRYRLYIADDGPMSDEKQSKYYRLEQAGHKIIKLPFDSGISVGRNAIINAVEEDYVWMTDDDVTLADTESLSLMRKVLDDSPDIGLVAAIIRNERDGGYFCCEGYAKGIQFIKDGALLKRIPAARLIHSTGDNGGPGYIVADQVPNSFLAKRTLFHDIKWDNRIKIEYEHMDFFLTLLKTKWKAAICLEAKLLHLDCLPDQEYFTYRRAGSPAYFQGKHQIKLITNQFA